MKSSCSFEDRGRYRQMELISECTLKDLLNDKLDVNHRRDDDASPMSSYRCMLRPT